MSVAEKYIETVKIAGNLLGILKSTVLITDAGMKITQNTKDDIAEIERKLTEVIYGK